MTFMRFEFRRARCFAVLFAPLLLSPPGNLAAAATIDSVWNGGTGNWSAAARWNPARVPNNTGGDVFNVSIDGGKTVNSAVTLDINATIESLHISPGDTFLLTLQPDPQNPSLPFAPRLIVNGNVTASGATLDVNGGGLNARVSVGGNFNAQSGTTIRLDGASLDVSGAFTSASGNQMVIGQLENSRLTVGPGSVFTGNTIGLGGFGGFGGRSTLTITDGDLTLAGGTTLQMASGSSIIGSGTNARLINEIGSSIQGPGEIGNGLAVVNRGIISTAGASTQVLFLNASNGLTNEGVFEVFPDSRLDINVATFNNYDASTGTLTGGTYRLFGGPDFATLTFSGLPDAKLVNNAATIEVHGFDSTFNALASLTNNSGSLTLDREYRLATTGDVTNSGTVNIGSFAFLEVGGGSGTYTQTAGRTNLNGGFLGADVINLNGGTLTGSGTLGSFDVGMGDLFNNASINPGGTLTIGGDYTQSDMGILTVDLGGVDPNLYDRLIAGGQASLDGTLDIMLLPGFRPRDGDVFTLLTYNMLMGQFATINGLDLGAGVVLIPTYGANSFFLTAEVTIPEPSTFLLVSGIFVLAGGVKFLSKK
jgi:hypothetical protein